MIMTLMGLGTEGVGELWFPEEEGRERSERRKTEGFRATLSHDGNLSPLKFMPYIHISSIVAYSRAQEKPATK
jgi:hypothetical protein